MSIENRDKELADDVAEQDEINENIQANNKSQGKEMNKDDSEVIVIREQIKHLTEIRDNAEEEVHGLRQALSELMCPYQIGDKVFYSKKNGNMTNGLVTAIRFPYYNTESEDEWELAVKPFRNDGSLSKVKEFVPAERVHGRVREDM